MQDFLRNTIREAGMLAKEYFQRGVTATTKAFEVDFLTEADTAVSDYIVKQILQEYPDHHILSEEHHEEINVGAEYQWVIDPIDGTRSFLRRLPEWAVSIGILRNGELVMGAIYIPMSDQLFFAEKGKGAYLNGTRIQVERRATMEYALISGFRSYNKMLQEGSRQRYIQAIVRIISNTDAQICNMMSSAIAMCYVAMGGIDAAFGNYGHDWDFMGGMMIAQEAGAVITDSEGNPWQRGRQDFIVANPDLHPKLLDMFRPTV